MKTWESYENSVCYSKARKKEAWKLFHEFMYTPLKGLSYYGSDFDKKYPAWDSPVCSSYEVLFRDEDGYDEGVVNSINAAIADIGQYDNLISDFAILKVGNTVKTLLWVVDK
jgi:hypothetical protein